MRRQWITKDVKQWGNIMISIEPYRLTALFKSSRAYLPSFASARVSSHTATQRGAQEASNVLHALALPALVIDSMQRIVDMNAAALRLLQLSVAPLPLAPASTVLGLPQLAIAECSGIEQGEIETMIGCGMDARYLELRFCRLHTGYHMVLLHDITDHKRAELAREALIESLEAYASTIAHDLKAPLATMMGFASLLEISDGDLGDDQRHYARVIQKSSSQMSRLIDELLLFASLQKLEQIPFETVETFSVINDVIERLNGMIREENARICVQTDLPNVMGYAPWLEVVFSNYLSNALKYGGNARIFINANVVEDRAYYWVHDQGAGISHEQREVLFNRAARFDSRKKGHGLGLMIVRQIIERLGGEVGVESTLGSGSTFWFWLPKAK
jgi:signal transduction histidine kinase